MIKTEMDNLLNKKFLVSAIIVVVVVLIAFNFEKITGSVPRVESLKAEGLSLNYQTSYNPRDPVLVDNLRKVVYLEISKSSNMGPLLIIRDEKGSYVQDVVMRPNDCKKTGVSAKQDYKCGGNYLLESSKYEKGKSYNIQAKILGRYIGSKLYFKYV